MGIITKMLKQFAVYWPLASVDSTGQPVWGSPVEIKCRWEDTQQEFRDPEGEERVSEGLVYTSVDVDVKGVLLPGQLLNTVDQANPKENTGAQEIRQFSSLPNFKATEFLRTAYL